MKKIFTTLVAILAISQLCYAQTNTAWTTNSNIGIGTTAAGTKLTVAESSGTSQINIASFHNLTNGAYTSLTAAGSASSVTNWANGQILEFVPAGGGNGIIGSYAGSLLFQTNNRNTRMLISDAGKVGIGTITPSYTLDVNGPIHANGEILGYGGVRVGSGIGDNVNGSPWYGMGGSNIMLSGSPVGATQLAGYWGLNIQTGQGQMVMLHNGNVGIGTSDPKGYKLAVNGTIRSKEVKVEASNWPDYVFKPTYKLPALSEVKIYIDKYQRLPEMPSDKEVEKNGIELGDMVKLQTKKIEELTLYLIEKDKQVQQQSQQLKQQQAKLDSQQKQLDGLQAQMAKLVK